MGVTVQVKGPQISRLGSELSQPPCFMFFNKDKLYSYCL